MYKVLKLTEARSHKEDNEKLVLEKVHLTKLLIMKFLMVFMMIKMKEISKIGIKNLSMLKEIK